MLVVADRLNDTGSGYFGFGAPDDAGFDGTRFVVSAIRNGDYTYQSLQYNVCFLLNYDYSVVSICIYLSECLVILYSLVNNFTIWH